MREVQELIREVGDAEKTTSFPSAGSRQRSNPEPPLTLMELTKDRCEPRLLSHPGLRRP